MILTLDFDDIITGDGFYGSDEQRKRTGSPIAFFVLA